MSSKKKGETQEGQLVKMIDRSSAGQQRPSRASVSKATSSVLSELSGLTGAGAVS